MLTMLGRMAGLHAKIAIEIAHLIKQVISKSSYKNWSVRLASMLLCGVLVGCSGDEGSGTSGQTLLDVSEPEDATPARDLSQLVGVWEFQEYDREIPSTRRALTRVLLTRIDDQGRVAQFDLLSSGCFFAFDNFAQILADDDGNLLWDETDTIDDAILRRSGDDLVLLYSAGTEVFIRSSDYTAQDLDNVCRDSPPEGAVPLAGPEDLVGVWARSTEAAANFDGLGRDSFFAIDENGGGRAFAYRDGEASSSSQCFYEDTSRFINFEHIESNEFAISEFDSNGIFVYRFRSLLYLTPEEKRLLFVGGRRRTNNARFFYLADVSPAAVAPLCVLARQSIRDEATPINDLNQVLGVWRLDSDSPGVGPVEGTRFLILRTDGSIVELEDLSELNDGSEDCYRVLAQGSLRTEGNNDFTRVVAAEADRQLELYIDAQQLILVYPQLDEDFDQRYTLLNLSENDLLPYCPQG